MDRARSEGGGGARHLALTQSTSGPLAEPVTFLLNEPCVSPPGGGVQTDRQMDRADRQTDGQTESLLQGGELTFFVPEGAEKTD